MGSQRLGHTLATRQQPRQHALDCVSRDHVQEQSPPSTCSGVMLPQCHSPGVSPLRSDLWETQLGLPGSARARQAAPVGSALICWPETCPAPASGNSSPAQTGHRGGLLMMTQQQVPAGSDGGRRSPYRRGKPPAQQTHGPMVDTQGSCWLSTLPGRPPVSGIGAVGEDRMINPLWISGFLSPPSLGSFPV